MQAYNPKMYEAKISKVSSNFNDMRAQILHPCTDQGEIWHNVLNKIRR